MKYLSFRTQLISNYHLIKLSQYQQLANLYVSEMSTACFGGLNMHLVNACNIEIIQFFALVNPKNDFC